MKAKFKLDKDALRGFFVQQSEKIVFGLFVLFGLLFCYGAVSRERYTRTPDEMQEESTEVGQLVQTGTASAADAVPAAEPLAGLVESLSQDFNPNVAAPEVWDLPLYPPKIRREEPVYLALSALRVHADTGPIAYRGADQRMAGPMGDSPDGPMGGAPAAGGAPPGLGQLPPGGPPGAPGAAGGQPRRPGAGAMPPGGMPDGMAPGGMPGAMGGAATGEESLGVVPPQGSRIEHREWVCLTGVVPVGDQLSEYNKKFGNASYRNPLSDTPQYVDFEILRAEVVSGVPADQLQWEELDVHRLLREEYGKWATVYPDVVSPLNEETMVCEPLPPLVTKNHDESHVGHPEIPLLSAEMRGFAPRPGAERAPDPEEEDSNPLGQPGGRGPGGMPGAPGGGFPGGAPGGMPAGPGGMPAGPGGMPAGPGGMPAGPGGMPAGPGGMPAGPGGIPGGQGMFGGQGMAGMMSGPGGGRSGVDVKKKLFRFFDFSVEQGKTYRYQVRLVLRNPNEKILPQYLTSPDLASGELRLSLWSEISEAVTIPRPINIVPGPVAQAAGGREPTARLIVRIWNDALGVGASSDATVARGSQIDFLARETAVVDPRSGQVRKEKIDVLTDSAVVDMSGGDAFTEMEDLRGAKGPSDLLVLNADGELEILSYFDDPGTYDTEMKKVEKLNALLEKPGGAGGGPPGLFGGMPGGAGGASPPGMPGMPGAGGAAPPSLFGPQQGGGRQRRGR